METTQTHTHEMYSVLLTHKWTNLKGLTIEVIYLETLLKETGNKATLECSWWEWKQWNQHFVCRDMYKQKHWHADGE